MLILRHLNLKDKHLGDASPLSLPNLRYLDLTANNIQDLTPVLVGLRSAENLEVLMLNENPVCLKPSTREKIIVTCPNVRKINDKEVDIEGNETVSCYFYYFISCGLF